MEGQSCLLSGGAPDSPVHHRTVPVACPVQISFQNWCRRPLHLGVGWRTGHCPVHTGQSGAPSDRWLGHASRANYAADRWPGRPLAHRTVRCTPKSPVNYSRTPLISSREQQVRLSQPGAPDTVRCTQTELTMANKAIFNFNSIFPISST